MEDDLEDSLDTFPIENKLSLFRFYFEWITFFGGPAVAKGAFLESFARGALV